MVKKFKSLYQFILFQGFFIKFRNYYKIIK